MASEAIGFNIQNGAGEKIADVKDIIIDVKTCDIRYIVLAYNSDTEGNVLIPAPLTIFTLNPTDKVLVIPDVDFSMVPHFNMDAFPYTLQLNWDSDVQTYWKSHMMTPASPSSSGGSSATPTATSTSP